MRFLFTYVHIHICNIRNNTLLFQIDISHQKSNHERVYIKLLSHFYVDALCVGLKVQILFLQQYLNVCYLVVSVILNNEPITVALSNTYYNSKNVQTSLAMQQRFTQQRKYHVSFLIFVVIILTSKYRQTEVAVFPTLLISGAPQPPGQPGLEPRHVFRFTKWVIFPNRTKMQ